MALGMAAACTGDTGPAGKDGTDGKDGSGDPSVSAVTPSHAYLGRTLDLTIAGSGTKWTDATTVAFSDEKIKVNKVTAASDTGLKVNVTISTTAAVGTADLTVTDGGGTETYKGAFDIRSPLAVTVDPVDGVPQGGFATVSARMLDIETPYDANDVTADLTGAAQLAADPSVDGDYSVSLSVLADVLATPGDVDLSITSGGVSSPATKAFKVTPRAPKPMQGGTPVTGTIQSYSDTALYQFTPADGSQRWVQFIPSSADGGSPAIYVLPKSGKFTDMIAGTGNMYNTGLTSADPYYLVVLDSGNFFANPPPYNFQIDVIDVKCTAVAETAETAAKNNDDGTAAQSLATLPVLVNGTLGYGTVDGTTDVDYYAITVTGAPKTIHAAAGGDFNSDTALAIFDASDPSSSLADSADAGHHEDVSIKVTKDGTYWVAVTAGSSFDAAHATYQLFIEVK
jgi:hypothetical protein